MTGRVSPIVIVAGSFIRYFTKSDIYLLLSEEKKTLQIRDDEITKQYLKDEMDVELSELQT